MTIREYNIVCLLIDKNINKDSAESKQLKEDLKELADCYISENSYVSNYKIEQLIRSLNGITNLDCSSEV